MKTNKKHGYDKIEVMKAIEEFIEESKYNVFDTNDYTVLAKVKQFACDLVNYLNKHG